MTMLERYRPAARIEMRGAVAGEATAVSGHGEDTPTRLTVGRKPLAVAADATYGNWIDFRYPHSFMASWTKAASACC